MHRATGKPNLTDRERASDTPVFIKYTLSCGSAPNPTPRSRSFHSTFLSMNSKQRFEEYCGCCDHTSNATPHTNAKAILERVLLIIEDNEVREVVTRLTLYLNHFMDLSQDGINLTEAKLVGAILEFFCQEVGSNKELLSLLCRLLVLCKHPLKLHQSSDKLLGEEYMSSILSSIGNCLIYADEYSLRVHMLEILESWFNSLNYNSKSTVGLSLCVSALKSSTLPECLVDLLKICHDDIYCDLLDILYAILTLSEETRKLIFDLGALEIILSRIYLHENKNMREVYALEISSNLLWHLLLSSRPDTIDPQSTIRLECFYVLRKWLGQEVKRSVNWVVRNNVAMIICQICHLYPSLNNLFQSGLLDDMTKLVNPLKYGNKWMDKSKYWEFQKILVTAICGCMKHPACKYVVEKHDLMKSVVLMMDRDFAKVYDCSSEEAWKMYEFAVTVLPSIAKCLPASFNRSQGNTILYNTLKLFLNDQLSLLSLKNTLRCVYFLSNSTEIVNCFSSNDYMKMFNDLLTKLVHLEKYAMLAQGSMKYLFLTITRLLEWHATVMSYIVNDGVDASLTTLRRFRNPNDDDPIADQELLMAIGDFLWEWIRNAKEKHNYFISKGGIFVVMDYIQKSNQPVKMVFCRLLVDLMDSKIAQPQVVTWRGEKRETILNLICKLWRIEEMNKGVRRDAFGALVDIESPLSSVKGCQHKTTPETCLAIIDLYVCLLPKLFAIRSLLFCRYQHIAEMAQDIYHVPCKEVTAKDEVTLKVIEHYYTLKQGEIWWWMWNSLNASNLKPLPMARTLLYILAMSFMQTAHNLKEKQSNICQMYQKQLIEHERSFYSQIQFSSLAKALEALRQIRLNLITADQKSYKQLKSTLRLSGIKGNEGFMTMTVGRKPLMEYKGNK